LDVWLTTEAGTDPATPAGTGVAGVEEDAGAADGGGDDDGLFVVGALVTFCKVLPKSLPGSSDVPVLGLARRSSEPTPTRRALSTGLTR
jgi:hypothetical protein